MKKKEKREIGGAGVIPEDRDMPFRVSIVLDTRTGKKNGRWLRSKPGGNVRSAVAGEGAAGERIY